MKIVDHVNLLSLRLEQLVPAFRVDFAAWCNQALWDEFSNSLTTRIGVSNALALESFLNSIWIWLSGGARPSERVVIAARSVAQRSDWTEADALLSEGLPNFGSVELIGCLQKTISVYGTGSADLSARCAEHVINRVDYELSMLVGVNDTLAHPSLQKELHRQIEMLGYLQNAASTCAGDRRRFRV